LPLNSSSGGAPQFAAYAVPGPADDDPLAARVYPENVHAYRSAFERDRGRILHARSFRRMAGKTQVFTTRFSDHFRSRLTHTLEVAQIARTVAGALGLNRDLAEALALAHDIGHPPFGHAGERALNAAMQEYGLGFDHNLHALRIVEHFEQRYAAHPGLNLTLGVREGIVKHSRDYSVAEHPELAQYFLHKRPPLEAQLIDLADEISYLVADLDDGLEANVLDLEQSLDEVEIFAASHARMKKDHPEAAGKLLLAGALTRMLNRMTSDLIRETGRRIEEAGIVTLDDVRQHPARLVMLSPEMEAERGRAKRYLRAHLDASEELQRDHEMGERVVSAMFHYWVEHPHLLPGSYAALAMEDGAPRVVADYIAGMTDNYILEHWHKL